MIAGVPPLARRAMSVACPLVDSTTAVPQPTLADDADGACELLLIRHGRSADVVPGSPESNDPPLHEQGVLQAAALDRRLARRRIDVVCASHLARARQTAAPLAERRGIEVEVHQELEEVRLGDWGSGEFRRRAAVRDPEWVAWTRTRRWDGIPGAEGDAGFRSRVTATLDAIAHRHVGSCVAVVAHGGTINAYLAAVLGTERTIWMTVENTSITVVRVGEHGHTVVTANDCHHLYDTVIGR
jgi:2,3-bisphosphoglycerate-dependent phosphoglycerate mutase